jgi:uncharacterized membrane protein YkvA (DUF1232 family)
MTTPPSMGFKPGAMNTARLLAHLPNFIKLYWRLFTDKRVSWLPKAVVVAGLLYFVVPIDAIFDFALPIGLVDDSAVLLGALWGPKRIVQEHVEIIDQGG